ncbi:MAG TPA: glycosyltransferase family 4 protein [Thermoproteota archaeon]|nr:glycosyltransferase family 4 protein [Thermoproteota archaeon]
MRIAFFVWEYPPMVVGGLGTYASYMTRELVKNGNDVTVLSMNPGNLPTRQVLQGVEVHRPLIINITNVFPIFVTQDIAAWGPSAKFFNDILMYNVLTTSKLVNQLEKEEKTGHQIVAFHDWLSAIAGISVKNELPKMPTVFHVHSTEFGRTGDGSRIIGHLEIEAAKSADKIITVSYAMKDDLEKHGWPAEKISVVWNGIDVDTYDPKKVSADQVAQLRKSYGIADDENMLLFVGRLTWVKGVPNLIQAMPEVLSEFPKTKLVILGKGEQQSSVLETAERLGISKNVIARFEFVPEEERIIHYAACDLAVFPSTYEPFGIVCLEAMSMEKPVVVGASGTVGFREQVVPSGPDQNGVHVNGNDPHDIAWGIMAALGDPNTRKIWGKNGRRRAQMYFTWEIAASQTVGIYQKVIDTSHPDK